MVFRRAVRQFKRMESIAKSPLYTHVQNCASGLATVQAYQLQVIADAAVLFLCW